MLPIDLGRHQKQMPNLVSLGELLHPWRNYPVMTVPRPLRHKRTGHRVRERQQLEELFACNAPEENPTLQSIQQMPMPQRRHAVFILLGSSLSTLSAMEAFQQSVHAVVNREELALLGPNILGPIVQRVVADNDLFLNVYRDSQIRMAQGKV